MTLYIRRYDSENLKLPFNKEGSLQGLTWSVKDIFQVKGFPCSFGILPEYIDKALKTSPVITELCENGAELKGAVTLSSLCLDVEAVNPFFDKERNPSQKGLLGSSFGSALSISTNNVTDRVDFSIGSDSGGSIRAPAASVRAYGLKLKSDFFSKENSLLLPSSIDSVGVMTSSFSIIKRILTLRDTALEKNQRVTTIVIPDEEALLLVSKETQDIWSTCIRKISELFLIKKVSKEFFISAFQVRSQTMLENLKPILANPKVSGVINKIPQALALKRAVETSRVIHGHNKAPEAFPKDHLLLHPTLTMADPITLFLPVANVFDYYSLSFPAKSNSPISLTLSGSNASNVCSFYEQHFEP